MSTFYDTHAHLTFPDFAKELPSVVQRARECGITRIITVGTDLKSSREAVRLADRHEEVFAVAGWHPSDVMEAPEDVRPELLELARHPKVVAIGETGLDYYRLPSKSKGAPESEDRPYKEKQARLFRQQLEVAAETGLNCVIHQRVCLEETLAVFEPYAGRVRAVFHCFVDGPESMRRIVGLGSLVSYTGILTFKNAEEVRRSLAATPPDKFMLETDSPFLAPVPYRGKRCEPAYVKEISEAAAAVRSESLETLSRATCQTAREFFKGLN